MTDYTAISDARTAPEAPLDTSLITDLRDNPIAITEGATGAPKIQHAALDSNIVEQDNIDSAAVGQSQLKSTTGTVSTTTTGGQVLTLPGGQYGFYPQLKSNDVAGVAYWGFSSGSGLGIEAAQVGGISYLTNITISSTAGETATARQRYIQSSPPYDLGDGEIPLFIFVEVDSSGAVVSAYEAPEAPWHNNGPTNTRADYYDENGQGYRRRRVMDSVPFALAEAGDDPIMLAEYWAAFAEAEEILSPITQEEKQADMALIPAPMAAKDGNTVILLDPVSNLTEKMLTIKEHDQVDILSLLYSGAISIKNDQLNRAGPPGVPVHAYNWRSQA